MTAKYVCPYSGVWINLSLSTTAKRSYTDQLLHCPIERDSFNVVQFFFTLFHVMVETCAREPGWNESH